MGVGMCLYAQLVQTNNTEEEEFIFRTKTKHIDE